MPALWWRWGGERAVHDWDSGEGRLFVRSAIAYMCRAEHHGHYVDIEHLYDRGTGLRVVSTGFERHRVAEGDGYNWRMAKLRRQNGDPPWSARGAVLDDEELLSYLDSAELRRLAPPPPGGQVEIAEGVVARNGGEFNRWGRTSGGDGLAIETRRDCATLRLGPAGTPVYVGRSRAHPRVVVVRTGRDWVGAFHEDGRIISAATIVPE
jgi:hypothetical protein